MSADKLDALIERVASKHGIVLSQDDPVLMMHTLNEVLLEQNENLEPFSQVKAIRGGSNSLMMKLLDGQIDFSLLGSLAPLKNDQLVIRQLFKKDFQIRMQII